jgi:DNA (cytosine-5)-methyltransferase 1
VLTIGSLCSGACDGLSLGLEWAGLGPTVWQVEIEPDRRANLARHWPDADRSAIDVRVAGPSNLSTVDIIVVSAPCQDLSSAAKRAGLDGPRSGLWWECQRIISGIVPRWVVVENVASGARNWVPHVRQGLERLGYTTLPVPIAAADCGAPHLRRRVFVLANADRGQRRSESVESEVACVSEIVGDANCQTGRYQPGWPAGARRPDSKAERSSDCHHAGWPTELEVVSPVHGVPGRVVSAIADSVVPQCAEVIGWIIRELEGI